MHGLGGQRTEPNSFLPSWREYDLASDHEFSRLLQEPDGQQHGRDQRTTSAPPHLGELARAFANGDLGHGLSGVPDSGEQGLGLEGFYRAPYEPQGAGQLSRLSQGLGFSGGHVQPRGVPQRTASVDHIAFSAYGGHAPPPSALPVPFMDDGSGGTQLNTAFGGLALDPPRPYSAAPHGAEEGYLRGAQQGELLREATPPLGAALGDLMHTQQPAAAAAAAAAAASGAAYAGAQHAGAAGMSEVYQAAYVAAFYAQQQQLQQMQLQQHYARAGVAGMGMGMPGMPNLMGAVPFQQPPYGMLPPMYPGVDQLQQMQQMQQMQQIQQLQQLQLAAMGFPNAMMQQMGAYGMAQNRHMGQGMDRRIGGGGRSGGVMGRGRRAEHVDLSELESRFGSVGQCVGQISALARDQHGCRFLQRKFDEEGSAAVELCFGELLSEMLDLMVDPFGNYLVQKLLDVCTEEQRTEVLRSVSTVRASAAAEAPKALEQAAPAEGRAGEGEGPGEAEASAAVDDTPTEASAASAEPAPAAEPPAAAAADGLYDSEEDAALAAVLAGLPQLVAAALNTHGTRAVQKLVETLSTPEQVDLLTASLAPGVVVLIKDLNGNHVVQRCLQRLTPEQSQFVYDAAGAHCIHIATHRHGCCVLQRCIDHATEPQRKTLVAEIAAQAMALSQDPFGNYVVQYVLNLGLPWASALVMARLGGYYAELSMQKFSSNVVEKCLKLGEGPLEECRAAIVRELTHSPQLERLLQDPYGNYVVQSALMVTKGALHGELVERIRPHMAAIKSSPFGKRILARSNLLGKLGK